MKRNVHTEVKKRLAGKHACYVLITCNSPSENGDMQIEMSYQGDATLASMMLSDAQSFINEEVEELLNC